MTVTKGGRSSVYHVIITVLDVEIPTLTFNFPENLMIH